jgi:hypothetical protein
MHNTVAKVTLCTSISGVIFEQDGSSVGPFANRDFMA